ncbi:hypothetical protein [Streptomyces sp. NPDC057910]|uniref:hypothetical protein n=1 Tax=Streptomyces sp. NPDC057910 TaxID=3346278 RepID=UPI0036E926CE
MTAPGQWAQYTQRLNELAGELGRLAKAPPASKPSDEERKAALGAVRRLSQHGGTLKRHLGVGKPKQGGQA